MDNETKESLWNIPRNILSTYSVLIVFMGIFGFVIYGIPYLVDNTDWGKEWKTSMKAADDMKTLEYNNVRNSKDCFLLDQTILQLVSEGANDKSWFPSDSDTNLRIGKERFTYLGCKN